MSRYEMTTEAALILEHLRPAPAQFTYDELRALTGVNDLTRLRGYLMTALRRMRKLGVWYKSERGIGYRKLDEDSKTTQQTVSLYRVKRHVDRIDKDQEYIEIEKLTHDKKLEHLTTEALLGLAQHTFSNQHRRAIIREVANGALPVRKKDD